MPKLKNSETILVHAKEFFFTAMLVGYVSGNKKFIRKTNDGHIVIEVIKGKFKLVDSYFKNPHSIFSSGTTTIYYDGVPVWIMHYGGWYIKEVIPFLKMNMETCYRAKIFHGGRGILNYKGEGYIYKNNVYDEEHTSFEEFSGREEITKEGTKQLLGCHNYFGRKLV